MRSLKQNTQMKSAPDAEMTCCGYALGEWLYNVGIIKNYINITK